MQPTFQMFPATGQLRLTTQATSGLVPFLVDPTVNPWFLRVVAIGPNCAALRGRAPDIELRADTGLITAVTPAPETATIPDGNGNPVAKASWVRDDTDVFTVKLDILSLGVAHTWQLRLTNTDPQELGFVWTSAGDVVDATRPRLAMANSVEAKPVSGFAPDDVTVPVANIGPGPLTLTDPVGTKLGAGFVLKVRPDTVAPNACDTLVLGVAPIVGALAGPPQHATFVLACDDPVNAEKTLQLTRTEVGKTHADTKNLHKDHKDDKDEVDITKGPGPPEVVLTAASQAHFIGSELRPDLSESALRDEDPDPGEGEGQGR
ncbi:hypothetical protein [Streptomyces sp. 1331.2]|uniref:hypothetical protein n=1 Tax=Streptomyces sp. 1331.2 TaxID=1938835 RepID=UPI000BD83161|nr:hypothetical protein [Streptomyces sp. 1331.2]SOB86325.1 hypothetical protein SAMN06272789_6636 [Streptomyces sp. 1331.2]